MPQKQFSRLKFNYNFLINSQLILIHLSVVLVIYYGSSGLLDYFQSKKMHKTQKAINLLFKAKQFGFNLLTKTMESQFLLLTMFTTLQILNPRGNSFINVFSYLVSVLILVSILYGFVVLFIQINRRYEKSDSLDHIAALTQDIKFVCATKSKAIGWKER